jgi:hypothetical protein
MAWKSPTEVNTTAGLEEFLPYLSEVTNFWIGRMLILSIFLIFLFGYLKNKTDMISGVAIASYVTFIFGLLLWVIGLITGYDFAIIIAFSIISSVVLFTSKDK